MARKPARAPTNGRRPNDDIGEEMRLKLYHSQFRLRQAEQRAYDLFLQNLVKGTSHLSLGQEAIAAGFGCAMQKGDHTFCTYRGHAHTLARGVPVEKVLGELMQRDNGLMRGKGGSMHLTSAGHGVMGSYAIIGAHLVIDGNDADEVYRTAQAAFTRARAGEGPSLIECLTYRHSGHSRADPGAYRPKGELERWKKDKDPINIYRERMKQFGIAQDQIDKIETQVNEEVDKATEACKAAPNPPMDILFTDVYADGGWAWRN